MAKSKSFSATPKLHRMATHCVTACKTNYDSAVAFQPVAKLPFTPIH